MRKLFLISVLAACIGLASGELTDRRALQPPPRRGDYLVLDADFHVHTRFSDGFLSPLDVVIQAQRRGLDAIAVTEHNNVFPAFLARVVSQWMGGPIILIGEEVTTRGFHIIGVGLAERIDWNQSAQEVVEAIHAQGGIAIGAHPVERFWPALEPVRAGLDAVELMHPLAYSRDSGPGWNWSGILAFYDRAREEGLSLTPVGSSDYHFFSPLGVCRTHVFVRTANADGVMGALREGHTVVYDLEGRAYGDPSLIAMLEAEPLPHVDHDYNYEGWGIADRVTRTIGFAGILGLFLFGRGRRG